MAVPFYVPDEDRENDSSSQPQSNTTSATQTPLQSPTNEHLVQMFLDLMSLYHAGKFSLVCSVSVAQILQGQFPKSMSVWFCWTIYCRFL